MTTALMRLGMSERIKDHHKEVNHLGDPPPFHSKEIFVDKSEEEHRSPTRGQRLHLYRRYKLYKLHNNVYRRSDMLVIAICPLTFCDPAHNDGCGPLR